MGRWVGGWVGGWLGERGKVSGSKSHIISDPGDVIGDRSYNSHFCCVCPHPLSSLLSPSPSSSSFSSLSLSLGMMCLLLLLLVCRMRVTSSSSNACTVGHDVPRASFEAEPMGERGALGDADAAFPALLRVSVAGGAHRARNLGGRASDGERNAGRVR